MVPEPLGGFLFTAIIRYMSNFKTIKSLEAGYEMHLLHIEKMDR